MNNAKVYNNTFLNCNVQALALNGPGSGDVSYNNLFYNQNAGLGSGWSSDYGAYFSTTGSPSETHKQTGSGNPFVNSAGGNFALLTATSPGTTLASPYNMDMFGNIRGADGVWDRGAIEYVSGAPPILVPNPPTNLNVN